MKVAIIGSRNANEKDYNLLLKYVPANASEVVSGGAAGVDQLAKKYANDNHLKLTEFLPDYNDENLLNKKNAPLIRNKKIVNYCDIVYAFWDGQSKGTAFALDYAYKKGKPTKIILLGRDI